MLTALLLPLSDGLVRPFKSASLFSHQHRRPIYSTTEKDTSTGTDVSTQNIDGLQKPLESLLDRMSQYRLGRAATASPSPLIPPQLADATLMDQQMNATASNVVPSPLTTSAADLQILRRELSTLKARMDKVEKTGPAGKPKTTISNFVDSLQVHASPPPLPPLRYSLPSAAP